jgi:hypothetical protein
LAPPEALDPPRLLPPPLPDGVLEPLLLEQAIRRHADMKKLRETYLFFAEMCIT